MDKLKGVAKGGWNERPIHRDTWKSDLKGVATGKKKDPNEAARNHQSAPLTTLRDPNSFGAPPQHTGVTRSGPATPTSPARPEPSGGWGSHVPTESTRQRQEQAQRQQAEEEAVRKPSGPYKKDTTGLRTDNLPPPPVRRGDGPASAAPATPPRNTPIASPPPTLPSRQPQQSRAPPPHLPPRMTENVDEFTPPPPPSYNEATQPSQQDPAALNAGAVNRLGQAGISVPGFGIGDSPSSATHKPSPPVPGHTGQLSELQQRFARMNPGAQDQPSSVAAATQSPSNAVAAAAAHKKPPPPPPPKKPGLSGDSRPSSSDAGSAPPPLPLSSKPRPPP